MSGFRRFAAPAALILAPLLLASSASGQSSGLFVPAEPDRPATAVETTPADNVTLRHRLVTIDFGMLERVLASATLPLPATLTLNLFEDAEYETIVERTAPTFSGGYSISGRIKGEPLGGTTLVVNGATVAGTVRTPRATYRIRSAGDGRYVISHVDLSKLPEQCEVVEIGYAEDPREPTPP